MTFLMTMLTTRQAGIADIDALAPLFDAYRQFYGKDPDLAIARAFLLERLQRGESVIFVSGTTADPALGFTQLYPCFSSVSAARSFLLNDLYVLPQARRTGVAIALLSAATEFARAAGADSLSLSTALDNTGAQALYRSLAGSATRSSASSPCRYDGDAHWRQGRCRSPGHIPFKRARTLGIPGRSRYRQRARHAQFWKSPDHDHLGHLPGPLPGRTGRAFRLGPDWRTSRELVLDHWFRAADPGMPDTRFIVRSS